MVLDPRMKIYSQFMAIESWKVTVLGGLSWNWSRSQHCSSKLYIWPFQWMCDTRVPSISKYKSLAPLHQSSTPSTVITFLFLSKPTRKSVHLFHSRVAIPDARRFNGLVMLRHCGAPFSWRSPAKGRGLHLLNHEFMVAVMKHLHPNLDR